MALSYASAPKDRALFRTRPPLETKLSGLQSRKGWDQHPRSLNDEAALVSDVPGIFSGQMRSRASSGDAGSHGGIAIMMDWVQEQMDTDELSAVGHRVVHGGPNYWEPERITPELIEALKDFSPFDPEHMPQEIGLIDAFRRRFPGFAAGRLLRHGIPPRPSARGAFASDSAALRGEGSSTLWLSRVVVLLFDGRTRTAVRRQD